MAGSSSKLESLSGTLLMGAAALAIVLDNSALAGLYDKILTVPVQIRVGEFDLHKPLLLWINDGLMAVFFLFVGLEIKREALEGQLSRREHAVLPLFAALGGVLAPSIIFTVINWSSDSHSKVGQSLPPPISPSRWESWLSSAPVSPSPSRSF